MRVFKFGGASVKDPEGVRNLKSILEREGYQDTAVVVSAMGKTTNNLEDIFKKAHNKESYKNELNSLISFHRNIAMDLMGLLPNEYLKLENELRQKLEAVGDEDYIKGYDMIVPYGELFSTTLIAKFLEGSFSVNWFDIREVIRTDQYFTEANIDWVVTERQIQKAMKPLLNDSTVVTQGFIGSDQDGNTTTLGREGSDFTGSVIAYCLNAASFTVWKDVPGILNADPRRMKQTEMYQLLSYSEVTEMTYYGAQVIHPKTLKPLAQKSIPLVVRSFKEVASKGTMISEMPSEKKVPCFVFKGNQLLVKAKVKDHSFMEEKKLGLILQVLDLLNIKINLMQNSALTLAFCIDNKGFKLKRIKELLNRDFILSFEEELSLATIKNYTPESFTQLPEDRDVIMEQKTPDNYQVLYKI